MAKIIVVLYDDPVDGYPKTYARDAIPEIESYPGGQTAPTPQGIDFKPGELLASWPLSSCRPGRHRLVEPVPPAWATAGAFRAPA
jgi:hypothetical protein